VNPSRNEPTWSGYDGYWDFIKDHVPDERFPIRRLVARRLAIATLLWTATDPQNETWDVRRWDELLPGSWTLTPTALHEKIHFNRVLWMRSTNVLAQTLPHELDWLVSVDWPEDKKDSILTALEQERAARR
jgi:hypothetical protein